MDQAILDALIAAYQDEQASIATYQQSAQDVLAAQQALTEAQLAVTACQADLSNKQGVQLDADVDLVAKSATLKAAVDALVAAATPPAG